MTPKSSRQKGWTNHNFSTWKQKCLVFFLGTRRDWYPFSKKQGDMLDIDFLNLHWIFLNITGPKLEAVFVCFLGNQKDITL